MSTLLIGQNSDLDAFDLLFRNPLRGTGYQPFSNLKVGYPCDIYVNEEFLIFDIPIVGGNIDDIKVTRTDDELRVSYHRSESSSEGQVTYITKNIARRDFDFAWKISPKFDLEKLHANYRNGLFSIQIPWAAKALPQEVPILDLSYNKA